MITTKDLYREFEDVIAVNTINLEIQDGEIFGLVGPNGAGKTTTLRMLAGNLAPTGGTAFIDGYEILKDQVEIRKIVGYIPDFFNFYPELKVWECLDYFAEAHKIPKESRRDRIDYILDVTDLTEKRDAFIKGLSRGMIQRLGLARAMLHDPRIYLLDEPLSGIDPRGRLKLKESLKKLHGERKIIMISSHILAELSDFCTSIGIMEKGKIISAGRIEEIEPDTTIERTLHLEVLSDEEKVEQILRGNERISALEIKGKTFTFSFKGDKVDITDLNEELVRCGVKIVSLAEKKTLEDIYLRISKERMS
ncbi:TPA: multidrug ABC transporter ATP-binding protein [bacterium]|nr:multidrug ABC transporter ATP-binding protein [bacterium]